MRQIDFEKINSKKIDKENPKNKSNTIKENSINTSKKQSNNSKVKNNGKINSGIKEKNINKNQQRSKNKISASSSSKVNNYEYKQHNVNDTYKSSYSYTHNKNNQNREESYNDVYDILRNFHFDQDTDVKNYHPIDMSYNTALKKINTYIDSINKIVSQYMKMYKNGKGLFNRLVDKIFNREDDDKDYLLSGVARLPKVVELMNKIEKLVIYVDVNYFKDLTDYVIKKLGELGEYYPKYY